MAAKDMVTGTGSPKSMERSKARVVAAYSGAHLAHQKMLADCCTTSIKMLGEWSVDRQVSGRKKLLTYLKTAWGLRASANDIIVIEGTTPTVLMAPVINFLNRHPKSIVSLCADDALYRTFVAGGGLLKAITRWSFNFVSGIIAGGDIVQRLAREQLRPIPIEIRYPSISEAKGDSLMKLKSSLNSHSLVLIGGNNEHCKGVDIAIECADSLRAKYPDAQLTVVGFPNLAEQPGVHSPGPVEDIGPYLSSSSVLIHPGRGDSFSLVIVEAMLAGVVPFVSEWVGASVVARKVAPELVAPLQAEEFAKRIADFWSTSPEHRQELSTKCRQVGQEFSMQAATQPSLASFIESICSVR